MAKSSKSQRAERINAALELIREHSALVKATQILMKRYGISKRQAYRYLREAKATGKLISIPETKIAFTVKLPRSLIQELRRRAALRKQPLGQMVTQALETYLFKGSGGGEEEKTPAKD